MTTRKWHKGSPPHIGWWNASNSRFVKIWRWWDGKCWSNPTDDGDKPKSAAKTAKTKAPLGSYIEWTNYYPENARVPRIDPRGEVK